MDKRGRSGVDRRSNHFRAGFCHSRDIAHLDVKPQNVFIKGDGITIRVGDFGSVMQLRSIEATIQGTSTEGVKNTLIYTPPESFTEALRRSARLDVWGFGHIIQELLTFEHAFAELMEDQLKFNPKSFKTFAKTNEQKSPKSAAKTKKCDLLRVLERIESGEAPNEIIAPPEEIIRRLRETNQQQESLIEAQKRRISELEAKLEKNQNRKRKIRELKQICEEQQENEQKFLAEIANLKQKENFENLSAKFLYSQKLEVAENGWNLKFQGGHIYKGDGWHHLWIGSKDGGVRFKAVVQEINVENGDELSRGEVTSEPDGQKQKIKYKYGHLAYKDGKYANIDVGQFETNQGVTTALDTATGETVIVKAILLQNASHWKSTQHEAATLRELDHANVVRFVDFLDRQTPDWAEFGAMSFIIMEYCAGGSLVDWIEKMKQAARRTTLDEARIIAAQMISGLSYCHGRNKVHLDLKPANIFVARDYITVKIGDFGSAHSVRSVEASLTTSSGDGIKCTPLYAAPEMHKKEEEAKKSPRLDVWGFALILQEVLTLEHPFGRVDGQPALTGEIMANIQTGKRTSLFEIFGETDEVEEFEVLLEKCTKVERTERPRNTIELRNEAVFVDFLERIESGERASSIVPSPFPIENDERKEIFEKLSAKFGSGNWLEVAENGWNLKFQGGYKGDGWHHLWIGSKDGGVRFKAVVQEIVRYNGNEMSRGDVTSEPDGQKQKIKYKYGDYEYGCYVRYNITLL
ncbi:Oidioi.mRNA.OKI2018_I69.XSR.g13372.t1.cds [Oikopleura dioica]|uniref:Oidioi.mRNA.OKI2018_I69.XSR.g13372.t1.cds n=1 Tax=Oikopleura dioica TaxID=34765 RepID=A0ABN7S8E6_OIKDI|nr:Oidioi.mRNA.OKI2018_I69.XSR.g13372.t1.cds [Oikopleura dioica]